MDKYDGAGETMTDSLSNAEIEELKAFACQLADAAATISLKYFRQTVPVDNKLSDGGFDPVTQADRGAEQAIRDLIESRYPEHQIFGEEFGRKRTDSPFEWVLDPIDGTRAFISGLPTWGTLIGLRYEGEPIIGVIDQPYVRERYLGWYAATASGATLNGNPISTRACPTMAAATLSTTDPDLFKDFERPLFDELLAQSKLVRYGLDCYAYAILASGFFDVILESGLEPYDMMALIPVVRGAGGSATGWSGESPGASGRLLAVGDPALTQQLLKQTSAFDQLSDQ